MRVRAKEKLYYDRRDRLPGEIYEMDDREHVTANLLCVLGKIEIVKDETTKAAAAPKVQERDRGYVTAAQEPEPEAGDSEAAQGEEGQEGEPTRKRYYRRRDMRAE